MINLTDAKKTENKRKTGDQNARREDPTLNLILPLHDSRIQKTMLFCYHFLFFFLQLSHRSWLYKSSHAGFFFQFLSISFFCWQRRWFVCIRGEEKLMMLFVFNYGAVNEVNYYLSSCLLMNVCVMWFVVYVYW